MQALLTEGCIKTHPFLKGCSSDFLNHLEEFGTEVSFPATAWILHEGDYADRCYLLCEGRVRLEAARRDSPPITIQTLGAGDVLGWSWLFPPFEWHFSARTLEPVKAIELNAASLLIRAEEDPVFGFELMKRISQQLVQRLQATRRCLTAAAKRNEGFLCA